MKKFYQIVLLAVAMVTMATAAYAVPARPGIWRKLTLEDGTVVHAQLKGNSHMHWYGDQEGNVYTAVDGSSLYRASNLTELHQIAQARECLREAELEKSEGLRKAPRKAQGIPTDKTIYTGKKKGIVILAQFPAGTYNSKSYSAVSFNAENPGKFGCSSVNALYNKIINTKGLDMAPFHGSVKDYFLAQSDGKFELDFDVVGPYTVSQPYPYYGANSNGNDRNPTALITEAISLADNGGADFTQYDWDNDGTVEVVYVLYAGTGEADGVDENTIWPHKSQVTNTKADGKTISIYACSNELATNFKSYNSETDYEINGYQLNGIGTICHEFSHTIGYPDMYDTSYSYNGCHQGEWDLMDGGSYNGTWNGGNSSWSNVNGGYCPAAYTAFERWCAGWLEPKVLTDATQITNLKPLGGMEGDPSDHGDAYVIYMPNSTQSIKGEYLLLENRQWANWDSELPWFGLLINYVHYNETYWQNNKLNTISTAGHERMTHFQACGYDYRYNFLGMDTYPYNVEFLPKLFNTSVSFYDTDGATMAANINSTYSDYSKYFKVNTASNTQLTNTQATGTENTVAAYYYGTGSTKKTLSNQEIWGISSNNQDIAGTGWFSIYRGSQTVNFNYKYPSTKTLSLNQTATSEQTIGTGFYTTITTDRSLFGGERVNTLWLPFDLNYADCMKYFGTGVKIYSFAGYTKADGFLFDETTYEGIQAYTPVVVVLGEGASDIEQLGGTDGFTYVQVNTTNAQADPVVESPSGWKFVGTKEYTTLPEGVFYVSNSEFYKAQGNAKLKAYRAYFQAPETEEVKMEDLKFSLKAKRADDPKVIAAMQKEEAMQARMSVRFDPTNPESPLFNPNKLNETGVYSIEYAEAQERAQNDNVYSLSGQRVGKRSQLSSMPRGIYIVNGKRVVVK